MSKSVSLCTIKEAMAGREDGFERRTLPCLDSWKLATYHIANELSASDDCGEQASIRCKTYHERQEEEETEGSAHEELEQDRPSEGNRLPRSPLLYRPERLSIMRVEAEVIKQRTLS